LLGIGADLRRSAVPTRVAWGMGDTISAPAGTDYLERTLGSSRGVRQLERRPEELPDLIAGEARSLWRA
jgi:hypothetical protein